ncbi:MAG TPA: polysaccharide deacetylase family protein, partial [Candidatus Nanopelagicales bacterium]|nr:polysaccharide deacetylase family protein [Candidatus Nanopelagicales bacterium]
MAPGFLRRVVLAAVLAAVVVPCATLAGPEGGISPARAAEPAAVDAPDVTPALPVAPTVTWHGRRAERVVALTFDDGWSAATLRQIFRILVRERVPATFFVTGVYVQRAPALWRQIAAAGFPLANHSYLHGDTRLLTPRLVGKELARTKRAVEAATGLPMLPYFRPPYGYRNAQTDRLAAAAGFPYIVMWDTTAADTVGSPTVRDVVESASAGRPGSIVLLHAGPRVTARALPAIIARY